MMSNVQIHSRKAQNLVILLEGVGILKSRIHCKLRLSRHPVLFRLSNLLIIGGVQPVKKVIILLVLLLPFYYPFAIRVAANHILGKSESKITPNKELSCLRDDVRNKWPLRGSKHAVYLVTQSIGQFLTTCC